MRKKLQTLKIDMRILTSFEKFQLSKVLSADFNGAAHSDTFNYLRDTVL